MKLVELLIGWLVMLIAGGATYFVLWGLLVRGPGLLPVAEPNERSLHTVPIPRGGGLSIALITILVWLALIFVTDHLDKVHGILLVGFFVITVVGLVDDRRSIPAFGRLIVEGSIAFLVAMIVFVTSQDGESVLIVSALVVDVPLWLAITLASLGIVWLTNVFNFMDGSDGMVSGPSMVAALFLSAWFYCIDDTMFFWLNLAVAGSCGGFLVLNWSPARVFLGDAGSLSLGYYFAVMALIGIVKHDLPIMAFVFLYGLFLADTTVTLVRRMVAGKPWWQAHTEHFYQRAIRNGFSHRRVATVTILLTLLCGLTASVEVFDLLIQPLPALGFVILLVVAGQLSRREQRG